MKLNKYILMTSALLMGAAAYADDFDDFGSFGDESSSCASSALEVNGSAESEIRAYVDVDEADADNVELKVLPAAKLDLKYSGNKSDLELKLKVDEELPPKSPKSSKLSKSSANAPVAPIKRADVIRMYLFNFIRMPLIFL